VKQKSCFIWFVAVTLEVIVIKIASFLTLAGKNCERGRFWAGNERVTDGKC